MTKKIIAIILIPMLLLCGCGSSDTMNRSRSYIENVEDMAEVEKLGGINLPVNTVPVMDKDTGDVFFDNIPQVTEDNFDSVLAYFNSYEGYVLAEDYIDEGTPYEERLAKEAAEMAANAGNGIAEFYNAQYALTTYFSDFVNDNLDIYNESASLLNMIILMFLPFNSWELSLGATLTEAKEWSMVASGVTSAFKYMGGEDAVLTRNGKHDYTVTYTNEDGKKVTDYFKADSEHGIQMLSYVEGELEEIFEYIQKDDKTHVWQSSTERLYMEWDGEKILKCSYTALNSNAGDYTEKDMVFRNFKDCDMNWVKERNDFGTRVVYDGKTLKINATRFLFGGECEAEIKNVVMP